MTMAAPKHVRLRADFHEWFPQGFVPGGEITAVMECQSQEDRARNRPVRPRIDDATGLPLYRGTFADPAAEKEREKPFPVEFTCPHQPVPPEAIAGLPFRLVVLEDMMVRRARRPLARSSGSPGPSGPPA
jgi:hypothetical protein